MIRRSFSIPQRLLSCLLLAALLSAILSVGTVYLLLQNERQTLHQTMLETAHGLSDAVDAQIARYETALRILSTSPALKNGDLTAFEAEARRTHSQLDGALILLATPDGRQIFRTADDIASFGSAGSEVRRAPIAMESQKRSLTTRELDVSDVYVGRAENRYVVSVNLPVIEGGVPVYVLAVVVDPSKFQSLMHVLPTDFLAAIADRNALFVARSFQHKNYLGQPIASGWRDNLHNTSVFENISKDGHAVISASVVSNVTGWASSVAVRKDALEGPIQITFAVATAIGLAVALGCGAILAHQGLIIVRAIRQMQNAVPQLRTRERIAIPPTNIPEIDAVIQQMDTACHDLFVHEQRREQHEEEMSFVMKELTHRSKNLLAVVQSIARLTIRKYATPEQFEEAFGLRLQALARCHDLLIATNWQGASFRELVEAQVKPLADDRLMVEGEDLMLSPDLVQPVGLALHELGVNATKYGALSVSEGLVFINWTISRSDRKAAGVCMTWKERHGPPVMKPSRKGFGHMVINQIALRGEGAKVTADFSVEGVTWVLQIPVPDTVAARQMLPADAAICSSVGALGAGAVWRS